MKFILFPDYQSIILANSYIQILTLYIVIMLT
jgi:hypothetical protein